MASPGLDGLLLNSSNPFGGSVVSNAAMASGSGSGAGSGPDRMGGGGGSAGAGAGTQYDFMSDLHM